MVFALRVYWYIVSGATLLAAVTVFALSVRRDDVTLLWDYYASVVTCLSPIATAVILVGCR